MYKSYERLRNHFRFDATLIPALGCVFSFAAYLQYGNWFFIVLAILAMYKTYTGYRASKAFDEYIGIIEKEFEILENDSVDDT